MEDSGRLAKAVRMARFIAAYTIQQAAKFVTNRGFDIVRAWALKRLAFQTPSIQSAVS